MKKFLIITILFIGCDDEGAKDQLTQLCEMDDSSIVNDQCSGDFIMNIRSTEGKIKYLQSLGYFVELVVEGTYDCVLYGVLCDDYDNLVDSTLLISGEIHHYTGSYKSPIGGIKIYSITKPNFNEIDL